MNAIQKIVDVATGLIVLGLVVLGVNAMTHKPPTAAMYHLGGPVERFQYVPGSHLLGCDAGAGPSFEELQSMARTLGAGSDAPVLRPVNLR